MLDLRNSFIGISLTAVILFTSCANKKKIIYFQGDKAIVNDTTLKYSPLYKADDLLSITVMSLDADAAKPFNLSTYSSNVNDSKNTDNIRIKGYLIDQKGEIDFPVIGKIKLIGLNRLEASELIKSKLKDYLKEPTVHIELINFKVTILGDVSKPGVYNIANERITLLEALGMAGDLNITGLRKNVVVIRDINGVKNETRIDLTTKDIFSSPVLYLQQNDIVYVEQNRAKKNSAVVNATAITLILSITTLGITLINLLLR